MPSSAAALTTVTARSMALVTVCRGSYELFKMQLLGYGAPRPSLARTSWPEDQVQARHDSTQMPAWIGTSLPGR